MLTPSGSIKSPSPKAWLAFWTGIASGWLLIAFLSLISSAGFTLSLSPRRLGLAAFAILTFLSHLAVAWAGWQRPRRYQHILGHLVENQRTCRIVLSLLTLLAFVLWAGQFIYTGLPVELRLKAALLPYYARFAPFLAWIALEATLLVFAIQWLHTASLPASAVSRRRVWEITAVIFGLSTLVGAWAAWTGIGVTPDIAGWGGPATPLLAHQIVLAALLALLASGLGLMFSTHRLAHPNAAWLDLGICALLWLAAAWLWASQPIPRSYFALPGAPPNGEFYPYSDAAYYDYISQSVQLGYGFVNGKVVPRPLYILALAIFHALAGQKYAGIIFIQTLVLALLPVPLYLLGKALHSRSLGLMVAILAILRELNAFAATASLEVSHSKLLLADVPTALLVIILTYLVVRWFQNPAARSTDPLLTGGFLGITALLRTQAFFFLPAILLGMLWVYFKQWRIYLRAALWLIAGAILAVSPWLYRNWQSTGKIVFDDPITQTSFVAERYRVEMEPYYPPLAGEGEAAYAERLTGMIGQFALAHPFIFARFVIAHYINNEITSLAILPLCHGFAPLDTVLEKCTAFWAPVKGNSTAGLLVLLGDLALVSFGVAVSWQRNKMAGVLPLLFHLAYNASNALARNSARRYILPVDWVMYFYFSAGLLTLILWVARFFDLPRTIKQATHLPLLKAITPLSDPGSHATPSQNNRSIHGTQARSRPGRLQAFWIGGLIFAVGLSLPLSEKIVPHRYPSLDQAQVVATLVASPALNGLPVSPAAIEQFAGQETAIAIQGRALYPRYYQPTKGEPSKRWPAYRPYERRASGKIGWLTVGPAGMHQVNLAIDNRPVYFPNTSDVIILGCQETDSNGYTYIDALLVAFPGAPEKTILRSKLEPLACPLQ